MGLKDNQLVDITKTLNAVNAKLDKLDKLDNLEQIEIKIAKLERTYKKFETELAKRFNDI